ncbi:MAG: GldG family protein [Verrucomicrobia bacterium]|nr:GldG family protein [Verrucomicrobiota bacterium]
MTDQKDITPRQVAPRSLHRWGIGLNALLQLVLLFALFLIVNYASYHHFVLRDLTPSRDYTLSERTTGYLRKLNKDVFLTLIFTRDSDTIHDSRALLEEFRRVKRTRIRVDEIDPARDLERAEELKLQNNISLHGNGILVRAADRVRFIGEEELIIRGADGNRDDPTIDYRGEDAVISAIVGLIEGSVRKFYFITGKGATGGRDAAPDFATLADIGRRQNIETAPLNFTDVTAIPPDADGLVLSGAQYDLSERELAMLQAYWNTKRAALLVLLNPKGDTPRLHNFLAVNGVAPRTDRVLFAESTSAGPRKEFSVQAVFLNDSPISKPFAAAGSRFSGQTQSLNLVGTAPEFRAKHIEVTPLIDAAERYWGESRYLDEIPKADANDTKPPVHIAASVERGAVSDERLRVDSARMVIVGNDTLLNPATRLAVDQDFISSSINWMLNRERLMGITPKRKQFFRIQLADDQRRQIFQTTVIMLPSVALLLGFLVWSHRRS